MAWRARGGRWTQWTPQDAPGRAPRRSEEDDDGSDGGRQDHAATIEETPTDASGDAVPGKTGGVKEGYEGEERDTWGGEGVGGYDETPKRRGPRNKKGVWIRYVGGADDGARNTDGSSARATGGEGEGTADSGGGNTRLRDSRG